MRKSLIAIPSVNGARLLERMLPTLNIPKDMIVVLDQGSTDNSEAVCRAEGGRLRSAWTSEHVYRSMQHRRGSCP
jgi:hypothetical protein